MKICPSCNNNNLDGALFCTSCGKALPAQTNTEPNNQDSAQQTAYEPKKNERIRLDFPQNGFISKDEYVVATLSNGIVDNILSGEGFKSEGATLTNERLYYNHKTGVINVREQDEKIDVKDITGTKISTYNPLGILIFGILELLIGIVAALAEEEGEILFAFFPGFVVFSLVYLFARKSHLKIEYAGGSIYFSVKKYGKENIRKFQKAIHAVKDYIGKNK